MYDHVGLKVKDLDLERSVLRRVARRALGHEVGSRDASGAGLGPKGAPALWLSPADGPASALVHVAFRAPSRAAVDRFHRDGLAAGGRDNGAPGLRADYGPTYYAAFLVDPDGHNVEAVCLE